MSPDTLKMLTGMGEEGRTDGSMKRALGLNPCSLRCVGSSLSQE